MFSGECGGCLAGCTVGFSGVGGVMRLPFVERWKSESSRKDEQKRVAEGVSRGEEQRFYND